MKSRSNLVSRAVLVALGVVGVGSAALADPPHWAQANGRYARDNRDYRDSDFARVIDVEPIVRRVRITTPDRECWNETQEIYQPPRSSAGSVILGGLIGGVLGHQIGHGNRSAPTVAGAVVGAAIGNQIGQQRAARDGYGGVVGRDIQRCNVVYREDYEERVEGYRVTYVYNGREYTTRMPYDPGPRLRVDVNVRPEFERR
jgi:uncharacterized protein YcfJ